MKNPQFWQALDKLIEDSEVIIDRPKGTKHPKHNFIYEVDYGYLANTQSPDGGGIDVWRGTSKDQVCDAIICTVDLMKKDSEIKILIGCNEAEKEIIMKFHNEKEFMKGLLFNRD
jgi:inorganic pyrophosphatase